MGFFGDLLDIVGIGDGGRGAEQARRDAEAAKKKADEERKKAEEQAALLAKQQAEYQQSMQNMQNNSRVDLGLNASSTVVAGGTADSFTDGTKRKRALSSATPGVATQLGINV